MLKVRRSDERGYADHGWLKSHHTFSFADYYDPEYTGFRSLRVINEDWVAPETGFGMHPHRDMEIITYVVQGRVTHQDSMGQNAEVKAGEIQCMTAGRGILHSEHNTSHTEPLHLLQIWITPERRGLEPSYQQQVLARNPNELTLVAARDPGAGALRINQDATLHSAELEAGHDMEVPLNPMRGQWLQLISGELVVNGITLKTGDALNLEGEVNLKLSPVSDSHFLLFDLG